ncbi:MAG: hypothetical protein ACAF41_01335 [Leptolyngbya sp. BL-A-14]
MAAFHQQAFYTALKGTCLEGEINFVHFLNPQLALMHAATRVRLLGQTETSPSRDSMQLFVITKRYEDWCIEGVLNVQRLRLERQLLLRDSFVSSLKQTDYRVQEEHRIEDNTRSN